MRKIIFLLLYIVGFLYAEQYTSAKSTVLSQKGKKIVKVLCDRTKLPLASKNIDILMQEIQISKACPPLSKAKLKAVAFYLKNNVMQTVKKHIVVPSDAKCPVCGMYVSKYPKWVTFMDVNGQKYYFDGVKDMMKYYIFDGDFSYDRNQIRQMLVSDYYTLEAIEAKKAFYVLNSDIFGPMGHELIPFKSEKKAKTFLTEHNGKSLMKFDDITDEILMHLDGL